MNLTGNRSHAIITHNKLAWTERTNQHTIEEELMVNVLIFHLHCYNHHSSLITHLVLVLVYVDFIWVKHANLQPVSIS